jgi:starch synthase (maltosyl-transferring)
MKKMNRQTDLAKIEGRQRVVIEQVSPEIDHGKFPVKKVTGNHLEVQADIFCDGHDVLSAHVLHRPANGEKWQHVPMAYKINDRWKATFAIEKPGMHLYTVQAWVDPFKTWFRDTMKKIDAGVDYQVDILVGIKRLEEILANSKIAAPDMAFMEQAVESLQAVHDNNEGDILDTMNDELYRIAAKYPVKSYLVQYEKELPVWVDREKAEFSTWYELFPRSFGKNGQHGTFQDIVEQIPRIVEMGFDVLYLPPIHPIGKTNRKGKNNTLQVTPDDTGSPWAIGSDEGGHKSIHPKLGTLDDFKKLVKTATDNGIEIALDIAFQCSPDHPYVKKHPEWFNILPDGSIKHAENPPKKYEDIYPINFETEDWQALWKELKSVFMHWIEQGVRIFRVDNPHTKSFRFWGWAIQEIQAEYPGVIFLSEAFTRPKVMYQLAKQGFTQSYTYFTWRNTKWEITEYMEELTKTEASQFFRPNFWPNTPDILPEFLQTSNRAHYLIRLFLASTLSSNYGMYGPAFELMDSTPREPGSEEYLDSEKYQVKDWDLDRKDSLKPVISRINKIRRENKALQNNSSFLFHHIENENLIAYSKHSDDMNNIILVVVNLDPYHVHSGWVDLSNAPFELENHSSYQVFDLISNARFMWSGYHNYVEIDPGIMPAHVFKIRRKVRTEFDFDYFL